MSESDSSSRADYGFGARLLHSLALRSKGVAELTFDLERALFSAPRDDDPSRRPVFIAGLARSGTTLLTRLLHRTGQFCSLTYRDMPFVLAPNLWTRLRSLSERNRAAVERAHRDGVMVDYDSPEAFEEVFWRVFAGDHYIMPDRLIEHAVDDATIERFRLYVSLVRAAYARSRYLSKNNNNVLRLDAIRRAFPCATILVPFRHPLQQASSLLRQHRAFCDRHARDPFSRRYMTWLGHHEFGSDHRPFALGENAVQELSLDSVDYWLSQWIRVYRHLLDAAQSDRLRINFISYERLCREPREAWHRLALIAALPTHALPDETIRPPGQSDVDRVDSPMVRDALVLYEALDGLCEHARMDMSPRT